MKIRTILSILCLAGMLLTPAFAQSGTSLGINVPYAFNVGGQSLPAGHYTFKANGGSALMTIQDAAGKHSAMTITSRAAEETGPADAQLVFRVHNGVRYLAGVWGPNAVGRALNLSKAERQAAGVQTAFLTAVSEPHASK